MKNRIALLFFILLVLGGGLTIGYLTAPGEWYNQLAKPPFNPPGWVFGPVWTIIYILIAIAGWITWTAARSSLAMKLWWAQLALNFAWSPTFFVAHQIAGAFAIILTLLAVIIAFLLKSPRSSPEVKWLMAPYLAWVTFASALNGAILLLNT